MPNIFFEVADGFFKSFLANSHGMKSKDQKRREKNQTRGTQPFDKGRDLVTASQSLEHLIGEFNWTRIWRRRHCLQIGIRSWVRKARMPLSPEELKGTQLIVRCKSNRVGHSNAAFRDPGFAEAGRSSSKNLLLMKSCLLARTRRVGKKVLDRFLDGVRATPMANNHMHSFFWPLD